MYKDTARAMRRHHYARLKNTRRQHWGYGQQGFRSDCHHEIVEMSPAQAGMVTRTPTPCSCHMCGNPRKKEWLNAKDCLTMQERKALDSYEVHILEV